MTEPTPDTGGAPRRGPWRWVPTLYFGQGIPYVVVMTVSVVMYKRLGISNAAIALYTSWLYLPWVIKPLWSPIVDVLGTKRRWTVAMQVLVGAGLAGVALTLPMEPFFQYSLAFLWLLAFASATHDIAADGFYMLALSEHEQAWWVGIRSTFYRLAMIVGQGLLVILAGALETATGLPPTEIPIRAGPPVEVVAEAPTTDEARIVAAPSAVAVPIEGREPAAVAAVVEAARRHNVEAGFVAPPEEVAAADDGGGWWTRTVAEPLEERLRAWFGERPAAATDVAGNVAVVSLSLAGPVPTDRPTVANLRITGDPSVQLVEGARLVFGEDNRDRQARVVVQLDPALDRPTEATLEVRSGNVPLAWSLTFFVLAGSFLGLMAWHQLVLPRPAADRPATAPAVVPGTAGEAGSGTTGEGARGGRGILREIGRTVTTFFAKPGIGVAIAFILLYRFAEAQLAKLASPFLLDSAEAGGLALTTGEVGLVYGTVGVAALTIGGVAGGILAARDGLKCWLWPMVLAINVPNAVYLFLAVVEPDSLAVVTAAVALEQLGYGFGFTAFLLFLIHVAEGPYKTAHYALCTGLMALGMMLPGMVSGWIQEIVGYERFFVWVLICTLPSFAVTSLVRIDPGFGRRRDES